MTAHHQTTVGHIDEAVLAFTVGRDVILDYALVDADCIGSMAHARMLAVMPVTPALFKEEDLERLREELVAIMRDARAGRFRIQLADQDVHLAVERRLTEQLGDLGKKIHTARSRNDQVAVDLRLYAKQQLLEVMDECAALSTALLRWGEPHALVPMVGRTHMQPAMPSSVGCWAAAHAESLMDDHALLQCAYEINDQCPLGSAASYGVPLPIDRDLTARLLGFRRPLHCVLYANNARGKTESIILSALSQVMLSLSRLAQDLMLFTMPEFGYFTLPSVYCTGSSIMPQKKNPDVLELVRAKASRVLAGATGVYDIVKGAPTGYNRDLQEAKEPFMEGWETTRACVRIMTRMVEGLGVNEKALRAGFTPDVFATDRALELVGQGMPFRDAYHHVKAHLDELQAMNPDEVVRQKTHLGAPAGIDWIALASRSEAMTDWTRDQRTFFYDAITGLLGVPYPAL